MPRKFTLHTAILLIASLAGPALAQSPLVRIQDILFKADGARFTGTLVIRWSTFDATNLGTVVQQSRSVSVVNGNFQIQLAANAGAQPPANVYTVSYQSDGREQFTETWSVPQSAVTLTVPQVRIGSSLGTGSGNNTSGGTGGSETAIPESSVVGLLADLGQRPSKGPGFGAGAVAVINSLGQVETAVGTLGDCVFVDGTTGPCGGPLPSFIEGETPSGAADGVNTAFTLQNPPALNAISLYKNGIYQVVGTDYTLSANTITFINGAQPVATDRLQASYRVDPAGNIGQLQQPRGPNVALVQVICSGTGIAHSRIDWRTLAACDIPASSMHTGDRFEIRFSFAKTGSTTDWETIVNWGGTSLLSRHAGKQDSAFIGKAEAGIGDTVVQVNTESYGTILPFLPGVTSAPLSAGVRVEFRGRVTTPNTGDQVRLVNYTILRYPGN